MKRFTLIAMIVMIVAAVSAPAFAAMTPFIVESVSTGQHFANYTDAGFAASSGSVTAPGCTGTGSRYSGTATYFGPSRYCRYSFTPDGTTYKTGYYEVDLAWTSTGGEKFTATNIYTGADTGGTVADQWGLTGGPQGILYTTTTNMYYTGVGVWNKVTAIKLTAGTTYKVGVYGGYKGANSTTSGGWGGDTVSNRVAGGAAQFTSATPTAVTGTGPADTATGIAISGTQLTWTAGQYNSSFDIYFGLDSANLTKVATVQEGTNLYALPDLASSTTYFWKVNAINLDQSAVGTIYSFTTIPEPGSMLALGTGLIGLLGLIRRKRA